jgi:hypothetical protein
MNEEIFPDEKQRKMKADLFCNIQNTFENFWKSEPLD